MKRKPAAETLAYYAEFFYIATRSDDTLVGFAICRRCGQRLTIHDATGRRNYFGLNSHLSKHVGERLRAEGRDPSMLPRLHRLTKVQRFILKHIDDHGGPMVVATGYKKTALGVVPATKENAVATSRDALYALVQRGFMVNTGGHRYELTPKGAEAIRGGRQGRALKGAA